MQKLKKPLRASAERVIYSFLIAGKAKLSKH
jgi:hypothetical protein